MAGRPKRRLFLAKIKERGGFEPIYQRIADGEPLTKIAQDYEIHRNTLHQILTSKRNPLFRRAYDDARKASAEALVEKAQELVDEVNPDGMSGGARVSKAKLQADLLKWRAGKLDADVWGDKPAGINVQFDVGALHVQALREVPKPKPIAYLEAPHEDQQLPG